MRKLSSTEVRAFRKRVYGVYRNSARSFPWRETRDAYAITVSELMLQQTQTARVAEYYSKFIKRFPSFKALAQAPLADVLSSWQGLGYNRRALFLKNLAVTVMERHGGKLPSDAKSLETLPGIGPYTAGALAAFIFGEPAIFIETNIRAVYLKEFFSRHKTVPDNEIAELLRQTVDRRDPRTWYYALMDYGVVIKKTHRSLNKKSAHYVRQSRFEGSVREIRGRILKVLTAKGALTPGRLRRVVESDADRFKKALAGLQREGLVMMVRGKIAIQHE